MKSKQQRQLEQADAAIVVDASIARAAGTSDAPTSARCRDFLDVFEKQTRHAVVISPEIRKEWEKHRSRLSQRWLVAMHNARRVRRIEIEKDKYFWGAFSTEELSPNAYAALHKDLLLMEAALQTENRVSSCDDTVRAIYGRCVACNPAIGDVAWVNPTVEAETPLDWLRQGAPLDESRLLKNAAAAAPDAAPSPQKS